MDKEKKIIGADYMLQRFLDVLKDEIAEKKLNKLGFVKVREDKYGITYEKKVDEYNYTHVVDILHKNSGKHIL